MKHALLLLNMSYQRDWDSGIVNRNYHLLQTIIHEEQFVPIIACDFIPFSFRTIVKTLLLGRPWKRNSTTIFRRWHTRVDCVNKEKGIYHVVTIHTRYLNAVLTVLNLEEQQTILWSYHPFTSTLFEGRHWALTVFDAVDNWCEHPSFAGVKKELTTHYACIRKNANVIMTVSEALVDFFEKKEHVYFIPNGVDAKHFSSATCDSGLLPSYTASRHPRIGYHGIIQSRVNFALLQYIAEHRPSWELILAGPVWKEVQADLDALLELPNVHYIGPVPYQQLPRLTTCFDCALIPHRVDTLTQTMNPLKIYEYLASGLPIVTTPVPGSEQFQDLITTVVSPEECITAIEKELAQQSPQLRQRRIHMAEQHSWHARFETMRTIIERHLNNDSSSTHQ